MLRNILPYIFIFSMVSFIHAETGSQSTGSLKFSQTTVELGRMALGSSTTRVITIKNEGTKDIRITKINVNCGCATGRVNKRLIRPGETIELLVTSKPSRLGKQTGSIFVYTDDPDKPRTVVHLVTEGVKPIKSKPAFVQFGDVTLGQMKEKTFELSLPEHNKFQIAKLNYNKDLFDVFVDKSATTGEVDKAKIRVVLKNTAPVRRFRESVHIDLATTPPSSCAVAFYGNVQGDLTVAPESLLFMGVTVGTTVEKTILLTSRSHRPFRVLSATSNLKSLKVEYHSVPEGGVQISSKLHAREGDKNTSGSIVVTTDSVTQPTLEIPVRIRYRRK